MILTGDQLAGTLRYIPNTLESIAEQGVRLDDADPSQAHERVLMGSGDTDESRPGANAVIKAGAAPGRARHWRWLGRAIGPIVLVVILSRLDLAQLRAVFERADPLPLAVAFFVPLPAVLLRALRWKLLLGAAVTRRQVGYTALLAAYAWSIFVGVATPGRLGEFAKVAYARREGIDLGAAVSSVLLDRLFDLALLGLLGAIALVTISPGTRLLVGSGPTLLLLLAALAGAFLVWPRRPRAALRRLLSRLPDRLRRRLVQLGRELADSVQGLGTPALLSALALTTVSWAITYEANALLVASLRLEIGYIEVVGISALCSLVALLPISILGAGTRDAALVALLARYGASWEQAIALSALMLSVTLWTALVCGLAGFSPSLRRSNSP